MQEIGAEAIVQLPYSGGRLADGGLVRLLDVVKLKPEVCIVEPLVEDRSRGLSATRQDLEFVYASLIDAGTLPVTVLLPWPIENPQLQNYELASRLCDEWGLPKIEFPLPAGFDTDAGFVDVHTAPPGGRLYATEIAKGLKRIGDPSATMAKILARWKRPEQMLKVSECEAPSQAPFRRIVVEVVTEAPKVASFRLLQLQEIGPFSPVFQSRIIDMDGVEIGRSTVTSAWDPYCHYARDSYLLLAVGSSFARRFRIVVEVADQSPDYSSVKRPVPTWPSLDDLHFRPRGPLYLFSDAEAQIRIIDHA